MTATQTGISGRIFAITGGASGMGAAAVRELARQNAAAIWIADWNDKAFDAITAEIKQINGSTQVYTTKVDVSDSKSVDAWISKIVEVSGGLHGAINFAGIPQSPPKDPAHAAGKAPGIVFEDNADIDRVTAVNFKGTIYCTRAEVRAMLNMPAGSNPAIVNIASLGSYLHGPMIYTYSSTKAAVKHFSQSVGGDVAKFGIRCNSVSPGVIDTPMLPDFVGGKEGLEMAKQTIEQFKHVVDPANVAKVCVWLLTDTASHVNGIDMLVGAPTP